MNGQIIANGQLVSYYSSNKQQNGCLIFLHGWRSQKEIWSNIINKFSDKSSYAIDLPGFGQSPAPKEEWTVGDYAKTIKEFIDKFELTNIVVIGHSFGGRVGIKLVSKYPNLVSKLVLVDSAGFPLDKTTKSLMGAAAKVVKPFFKPKFMQGLRKSIYKQIGAEDYLATPELQKTFVNVTSEDLANDLKNIKCPTLIITGENDQDAPVVFGEKMNRLILNSKLKILNDAGHFSFLDKPVEFEEILKKFL